MVSRLFPVLVLLIVAGFSPRLLAQGLTEIQQRQKVAAQALEYEIREILTAAEKAKDEPAKALALAKLAQSKMDGERVLAPSQRTALRTRVAEQVRFWENQVARAQLAPPPPPPKPMIPAPVLDDGLKRELDTIKRLRDLGEYSAAQKLAADVAAKHPNNPHANLARQTSTMEYQLRDRAKLTKEQGLNNYLAMLDVYKSGVPIVGDISFPPAKRWAEINQRAEKYKEGLVKFTDREKAILKSLSETTEAPLDLKDLPLEDVLKYLEKDLNQPFQIDEEALRELGISYESKIKSRLPKGISKRAVLRQVLAQVGLAYVVKNEMIYVTSKIRAQNEMVTRYYPIDDLIGAGGWFSLGNPLQEQLQVDQIIQMIQSSVDPSSWSANGGTGTISYYGPTRTLVIRNTAEVINSFGGGMTK